MGEPTSTVSWKDYRTRVQIVKPAQVVDEVTHAAIVDKSSIEIQFVLSPQGSFPGGYCRSGNFCEFSKRTNWGIQEFRENYYYSSATEENSRILNFVKSPKIRNSRKFQNAEIIRSTVYGRNLLGRTRIRVRQQKLPV